MSRVSDKARQWLDLGKKKVTLVKNKGRVPSQFNYHTMISILRAVLVVVEMKPLFRSYCASLLLSYGADITSRTNGGMSHIMIPLSRPLYYHHHCIIIRNVCPLNDSEENSQRLTKVWGYARSGENFEKLWNLKSSTCETLLTSSICFETVKAISLAEHDINDVDCELKLDYKVWSNEWKYMKINISGAHSYQRERRERYVHGIHRNWVIWQ